MRILIAEDEAVSRRLLERRLTEWGHEVVAAVNGREALAFFREAPFSLVITDWVMPEMDGLELVRRIRREAEEYVYIIMLTSKAEKSDLVKGMDNGADDFIHKPFDKEELRVRLRAGERIVELEARLKQKNEALSQASDKMFESIRAAAVIQNSLLPAQVPDLPNVRVAWRFQPCDELAGDILNVLQLDEENLGFYVLDVSGHGVPAALLAVTLSRILSPLEDQASLLIEKDDKTGRQRIVNPATVANNLNRRFQMDMVSGQYFTMLYAVFNLRTRELRMVNAGHPAIVYAPHQKEPRLLEMPSLPIGFIENADYREERITLGAGDRIFLYSDGIPETDDGQQRYFGTGRLLKALDSSRQLSIEENLDGVLRELTSWRGNASFSDDITLLGLEVHS